MTDANVRASVAAETRTVYAAYLGAQALLGVLLWVLIASSATVRSWFELDVDHRGVTDAFFLADMVVVAGSALAAWGLFRGRRWAVAAVAFTLGGVVYPTVYLCSWVTSSNGVGVVALGLMLGVTGATGWVLWDVSRLDAPDPPPRAGG